MENFVMAIPSYRRAEKQITLDYLSGLGIPKERIYIFVQTANDREAYKKHEDRANIILTPANGVAAARNNALRYFSGATNILMFDDDVSSIGKLRGNKLVPIDTREEFAELLNKCFNMAQKRKASLFGIYPVHNAFFMSPSISTTVTVNTVIGFTKGHELLFDESYKTKEDIEMCARVLEGGGEVLRYNFLAPNAKHRTNAGGCYEIWHSDENLKTVERLSKAYPNILAPQKNKPHEARVLLRDNNRIDLRKKKKE